MNRRRHLSILLALLAIAGIASAQETDVTLTTRPGAFFETVDVNIVNIEVFVTDKSGLPVTGLQREDFELLVDGAPREITNFYTATRGRPAAFSSPDRAEDLQAPALPDVPARVPSNQTLYLAVVVDNEHIRSVNRARVFRDLRKFLATRLEQGAFVTMSSLNPELVIHSDFVDDPRALGAMLDELERAADRPRINEIERRQILSELSTTGRIYNRADYAEGRVAFDSPDLINRIRAYAQIEFNASQSTLRNLSRVVSSLAGVEGRKALLYVSEGIVNRPGEEMFLAWSYRYGDGTPAAQGLRSVGSDTDYFREIGRFDLMPQVRELAQLTSNARVGWYTIDAESDHGATLRSAAVGGSIASETLDVLEANVREPAELIGELTGGRRIQASTSLERDLAAIDDFDTYYSLGFARPSGSEAGVHDVRVKVRGKGLKVRHRASFQLKSDDDRMADATVATLLYQKAENPLGLVLRPGARQERDDGDYILGVEVQVPLRNIALIPTDSGTHVAQLSLYVTIKGPDGQPRPVQKLPFSAAIPDEKLEEALGHSTHYTLPVVMRRGDQQIAVGVRDELGFVDSFLRLEITGSETGS
ncbi:MAG: VWA domain-containing protein [bacterium]|nr:VWA domain-containing protein [bacterium]